MQDWNGNDRCRAVPLFPLPNVVLFPRAALRLHIFEQRYREMTRDALRGRKLVAMALLAAGWERNYYARPEIDPVVCVGRIVSCERLADGKYNFLLLGLGRARIDRELEHDKPYRAADLMPLVETDVMEIDLSEQRAKLCSVFEEHLRIKTGLFHQFRQMLRGPISTADIADLIAFNLLEDMKLKQSLLSEGNVVARVEKVISALKMLPIPERSLLVARVENPSWN